MKSWFIGTVIGIMAGFGAAISIMSFAVGLHANELIQSVPFTCQQGIVDLAAGKRLSSPELQQAVTDFEAATGTHFYARNLGKVPESFDVMTYLNGLSMCPRYGAPLPEWPLSPERDGNLSPNTTFIIFYEPDGLETQMLFTNVNFTDEGLYDQLIPMITELSKVVIMPGGEAGFVESYLNLAEPILSGK